MTPVRQHGSPEEDLFTVSAPAATLRTELPEGGGNLQRPPARCCAEHLEAAVAAAQSLRAFCPQIQENGCV